MQNLQLQAAQILIYFTLAFAANSESVNMTFLMLQF